METNISALEEKHILSILLFLLENGVSKRMDIYENITRNPRVPDKLDRLEELGLIVQRTLYGSRRIDVELTETGVEVAKLLRCISDIMQNSAERD